ncbi:MAG: hypothetical protein ACE5OZ_04660 [Candidatus Heimdallarchaeota archaeon]
MLKQTCFFKLDEERPKTSEELLRFDYCRRKFEKRLKEVGDDAIQRFDPIVQWMRQVIAERAPELLHEL